MHKPIQTAIREPSLDPITSIKLNLQPDNLHNNIPANLQIPLIKQHNKITLLPKQTIAYIINNKLNPSNIDDSI